MKIVVLVIVTAVVIILGGFLIPLKTVEAYDCVVPPTVRLHFIKGDSINKARTKYGAFESNSLEGRCAITEPTKYKLYLL